ncbi:MAG: hypothetical protein IT176_05250 [Acidobacteria bacterium]|nr:hypothetical protein [Acidobacteriota bacterium]
MASAADARAQRATQRGFVEARAALYPQAAPSDPTRAVGDLLAREEVFAAPTPWLQLAGGLALRGNTHDQVGARWAPDFWDRSARRPPWSIRQLSVTLHRGALTIDLGKQFVRWGRTDIVTPTDRFAPRDFLNVVDNELLAVTGVRGTVEAGAETIDAVVVPRFTPSRMPLFAQRWGVTLPAAAGIRIVDNGARYPEGVQAGVRWSHAGSAVEYSLSYFDGFNHLPNIDVRVPIVPGALVLTRVYPHIRSLGADAAIPTRWFTVKVESAYFASPDRQADEYVLYVVELERLAGEWVLAGGYAGEAIVERRVEPGFAPDRGLARALVGRASYTIDVNRSAAVEGAVRQDGDGAYLRLEYSQARGAHWRATLGGSLVAGRDGDFLGQYRRNAHVSLALRYSF